MGGKHRYRYSGVTKDGQKWTMTCPQAACKAKALVRKGKDGQFYLDSCSKTHNHEINEASVIAERFKLKMGEIVKSNPSAPVKKAIGFVKQEIISKYAHHDEKLNNILFELGSYHSLEQCLLRRIQPTKLCIKCNKMFRSETFLKNHIKNRHPKECSVCNKCRKCVKIDELEAHNLGCNTKEIDKTICTICNKRVANVSKIQVYIEVVHGNPDNGCSLCGKKVKNMKLHKRHRHSDISGYEHPFCIQCGKKFTTKGALRRHKEKIHEDKKEQCIHCGMWFRNFTDHVKTHKL